MGEWEVRRRKERVRLVISHFKFGQVEESKITPTDSPGATQDSNAECRMQNEMLGYELKSTESANNDKIPLIILKPTSPPTRSPLDCQSQLMHQVLSVHDSTRYQQRMYLLLKQLVSFQRLIEIERWEVESPRYLFL